ADAAPKPEEQKKGTPVGDASSAPVGRFEPIRGLLASSYLQAGAAAPSTQPAAADLDPARIAPEQGKLAERTETVKLELLDEERQAAQPLDAARRAMAEAGGKLSRSDP